MQIVLDRRVGADRPRPQRPSIRFNWRRFAALALNLVAWAAVLAFGVLQLTRH